MNQQNTSRLLMIRPVSFRYNEQTATNNHYQRIIDSVKPHEVHAKALVEFDGFVAVLRQAGVDVTVVDDTLNPDTPDSIFPNNWVSFHADGRVFLYPMFALNRRLERRNDILETMRDRFQIASVTDLSSLELKGQFLEGTGSLVLDRANRVAYACLSARTMPTALQQWADFSGYRVVSFTSTQQHNGQLSEIYHTNVMMSVGHDLAIVCANTVRNPTERSALLRELTSSGHRIIEISEDQKNSFAGNMLEVTNANGQRLMVMSTQAYTALAATQKTEIELTDKIVHAPLDVIETFGGGSARCMMAEVFLPLRDNG